MNVSVLVGSDKQLTDLVRACGAHTATIEMADLKALAMAGARQPDVLVVDVRERSTMPVELAEIKRQHPSTGIVVVLPGLDGTLVLQAMRAGASECVAEPVTRGELEGALSRIAAQRPSPRRGDVFAVIGAKGGVGATTVAVNVATILNKLRASSTLLMDLHLTYGDAATFLASQPARPVAAIARAAGNTIATRRDRLFALAERLHGPRLSRGAPEDGAVSRGAPRRARVPLLFRRTKARSPRAPCRAHDRQPPVGSALPAREAVLDRARRGDCRGDRR